MIIFTQAHVRCPQIPHIYPGTPATLDSVHFLWRHWLEAWGALTIASQGLKRDSPEYVARRKWCAKSIFKKLFF